MKKLTLKTITDLLILIAFVALLIVLLPYAK